MVSPTPMDLTMPSAFLAMPRGARLYGSPVVGSSTSQTRTIVVSAKNGSMQTEVGSGIRHMSDSLIAFQPAIEEPSNIMPSANVSSSIWLMSKVTCCHLPRGSVKRKSTYFTSLSLIIFMTFFGVVMAGVPFRGAGQSCCCCFVQQPQVRASAQSSGSDGVKPGFPRPDPDGFFDVRDEDLAVADPPGLGSAPDRLDRFFNHVVAKHNLDFHLGKKIDDIFGAAVEFGVSLLAPKPLGLGHRYSLQTHLLQRLLHLVEFERLDDRLDLFHRVSSPSAKAADAPLGPRLRLAGPVPRPRRRQNGRPIKALYCAEGPLIERFVGAAA